ncbi:ATP-binding protein, partial [Synechococcus sp. CS-1326]|nr:ATP-binding protein [Synechococcus sp. CS-1326]
DRPARFFSATTLVQELQRAKADYALARALTKLDRYALLVIDDNRFAAAYVVDIGQSGTYKGNRIQAKSAEANTQMPF